MARLNIEDQFFLEVMTAGSLEIQDRLAGNALRFFRYAQEKHKRGQFVSEEEFKVLGFMEELFPLFARRTDDGIQCAGAEKHFNWLSDQSERGQTGGRVSAQRERDGRGRLLSKQTPSGSKQTQAIQASPSPSSSLKKKKNEVLNFEPKKRRTQEPFHPKSSDELWAGTNETKKALWRDLYPDEEFISRTVKRAYSYYTDDKPADEPRSRAGWTRALNHWFETGWAQHRKSKITPASPANYIRNRNGEGPRPIKYPDLKQVVAEQEQSRSEHDQPVSTEERARADELLKKLTGKMKLMPEGA